MMEGKRGSLAPRLPLLRSVGVAASCKKLATEAAPLPPRPPKGPTDPADPTRTLRARAGCLACRERAAYSQAAELQNGLRRPQRRRADRRGRDARDLRDVRVSSQPAAAAEQKTCVRCCGRRDRALRDLGPGRWSFLRPYYRFCDIAACFTSGDVQIRHKRTTSHNKKVGRQQAEALVSRSGSGPLYDARRHYCHNS